MSADDEPDATPEETALAYEMIEGIASAIDQANVEPQALEDTLEGTNYPAEIFSHTIHQMRGIAELAIRQQQHVSGPSGQHAEPPAAASGNEAGRAAH